MEALQEGYEVLEPFFVDEVEAGRLCYVQVCSWTEKMENGLTVCGKGVVFFFSSFEG